MKSNKQMKSFMKEMEKTIAQDFFTLSYKNFLGVGFEESFYIVKTTKEEQLQKKRKIAFFYTISKFFCLSGKILKKFPKFKSDIAIGFSNELVMFLQSEIWTRFKKYFKRDKPFLNLIKLSFILTKIFYLYQFGKKEKSEELEIYVGKLKKILKIVMVKDGIESGCDDNEAQKYSKLGKNFVREFLKKMKFSKKFYLKLKVLAIANDVLKPGNRKKKEIKKPRIKSKLTPKGEKTISSSPREMMKKDLLKAISAKKKTHKNRSKSSIKIFFQNQLKTPKKTKEKKRIQQRCSNSKSRSSRTIKSNLLQKIILVKKKSPKQRENKNLSFLKKNSPKQRENKNLNLGKKRIQKPKAKSKVTKIEKIGISSSESEILSVSSDSENVNGMPAKRLKMKRSIGISSSDDNITKYRENNSFMSPKFKERDMKYLNMEKISFGLRKRFWKKNFRIRKARSYSFDLHDVDTEFQKKQEKERKEEERKKASVVKFGDWFNKDIVAFNTPSEDSRNNVKFEDHLKRIENIFKKKNCRRVFSLGDLNKVFLGNNTTDDDKNEV